MVLHSPFLIHLKRVQGIWYGNNEFGAWLTCTGVGTSAILCQTLIVTVVLERQNCGTHPTLAPQAGKAHDVSAAAQLEHFALANEALVIDVDAQLQVARIEGEAFDVACDLIDLRLQAALRCLGPKENRNGKRNVLRVWTKEKGERRGKVRICGRADWNQLQMRLPLTARRMPHVICDLHSCCCCCCCLRMCASVLAAACGPQMVLTALQRSRKYEIRLADIRTTANI